MKKVYWRPRAVSKTALLLISFLSVGGIVLVENVRFSQRQPWYKEKRQAAEMAQQAIEVIREERFRLGVPIDSEKDPSGSGLIGIPMSPVTSISGVLEAKQTSINPNFAAVVVEYLRRAGVEKGEMVAIGCSGSFPGLNVAVYSAIETLELRPIVICSAAASQWGANIPELLWIDMERHLHERGLISFRSIAASIGGYEDSGLGLTDEGRVMIEEGIKRNNLPLLPPVPFEENVNKRMSLYQKSAKGSSIKCYINVGGGTVSVGRSLGKKLFHPGLNKKPPTRAKRIDGLMSRFVRQRVPVIHMVQVNDMAERHGMALSPTSIPNVGEANVFEATGYNRWLAIGVLVAILASLFAFIRSDVGFRLLQPGGAKKDAGHPEPMV